MNLFASPADGDYGFGPIGKGPTVVQRRQELEAETDPALKNLISNWIEAKAASQNFSSNGSRAQNIQQQKLMAAVTKANMAINAHRKND